MKKNKIVSIGMALILLFGVSLPSQQVDAEEDKLVIVLDPGHGGKDGGASNSGILEKTITLKIANYMKTELQQFTNVDVELTRSTDMYYTLQERAQIADKYNADIHISLHANSSTSSSASGVEIFYPNANYISNFDTDISYEDTKSLAQRMQNGLASLGLYNRGIKIRNIFDDSSYNYPDGSYADYYGVIRESKKLGIPALIIEHGFLSNTYDRTKFLSTDAQLKAMAMSNVSALVEQFDLKIITEEVSMKAPEKTEYIVGESIDLTGLSLKVDYSDGTSEILNAEDYTVTGFDSSVEGNKVITVTYKKESLKFLVTILPEGAYVDQSKIGDVNGDGEIKASDYLVIKDSFLQGIVLSEAQVKRADVKQDGEIKASDYLMIKDYFMGKLESLPGMELEENISEIEPTEDDNEIENNMIQEDDDLEADNSEDIIDKEDSIETEEGETKVEEEVVDKQLENIVISKEENETKDVE